MPEAEMTKAITPPCPFCQKTTEFTLPVDAVRAFNRGESYIQDLFPMLSAGERERLQSGICPPCWDKELGEEPDDDFFEGN